MKILFLHPNQPSQFRNMALAFARDPANQVVFLSRKNLEIPLPGVRIVPFREKVPPDERCHRFVTKFVEGCHRATAVASVCLQLRREGFVPDVIVAHSGWGDGMYLRTVYPETPQLNYMEFFFQPAGADLGFFPKAGPPEPNLLATRTTDNAIHMANYFNADWCLTPTYWQRSVHPREMRNRISVLHEGVDTGLCAPRQWPEFRLPGGRVLDPSRQRIVTHVERHFDRYRGFPTFLKSIDLIQQRHPDVHVVVVGKEGDGYAASKKGAFLEMIRKTPFDRQRTHFVGHLPYPEYLKLLQVSSAHVYLTVPFVLSWSFLEAMAVGCPIACSDTQPVRELAEDGTHCLMFGFFDPQGLADRVSTLLDDRDLARRLGAAARARMVEQYDVRHLLPMALQLVRDLAEGKGPGRAAEAIRTWNVRWGREEAAWQKMIPLHGA